VDYDPWLGALALLGLVMLVARALHGGRARIGERGRDAAILGAHGLAHVVAFGVFDRTFQRFLMPVVPYLCMLAAYAVASAVQAAALRTSSTRARARITTLIVAIALVPQAFVAFKLAWLRAAPDTLTLAAEWLRDNADSERDRIALAPTVELPLLRRSEDVPAYLGFDVLTFSLWPDYQVRLRPEQREGLTTPTFTAPMMSQKKRDEMLRDPDAFVRELGARFLVVDVNHDARRPIIGVLRQAAMRQGRLVAHFGPRDPTHAGDLAILYNFDGPGAPDAAFAWRAARWSRQGPDIEIYALDP
jgi:hypothetical protein